MTAAIKRTGIHTKVMRYKLQNAEVRNFLTAKFSSRFG